MSFDTERLVAGREPISIVELHLDYCSLDYGVAPCTAEIGTTGIRKCYNTRFTCQDVSQYANYVETKTYRFSTPNANTPANMNFFPSVRNVGFSPTKIDPGKSLGRRGQCTITLQDHPHHDVTIDKYVDERSYIPYDTGTFWAKFKVRNRYYNGRIIRVYSGYLTEPFNWNNFQTRTYVIDQIDGPSSDGRVTITGRDILKLADDERAVCPRPTVARIDADMAVGGGNADLLPVGAGSNFNDGDYVRIDKEIIRINTVAGDNIIYNVGDRGQFNTDDKTHSADDAVQLCKYFYQDQVADIIKELLVDYGNVPIAYIDDDEWDTEAEDWLEDFVFTAIITEPTGVTKLINELIQNSTSYIFWNEIEEKVKLIAIKPPEIPPQIISDENSIIKRTVRIQEKPDKRRTEFAVYYVVINPVEKLTESKNFQRLDLRVDVDAESEVEYNDVRTEKLFSRWLGEDNDLGIETLQVRFLAKYRNIPIEVMLRIDAKDIDLWTGDEFYIYHRNIVDDTGEARYTLMRIIEASESVVGTYYTFKAVESEREFEGRYCYIQVEDRSDFLDVPVGERDFLGGWLCDDTTLIMPDETSPYLMP